MTIEPAPIRNPAHPFNTVAEAGLRSLLLLETVAPAALDIERLVYYDYFLVHSGDVPNGPASLHPATPYRSGELLVRRTLVQQGLRLMIQKELARPLFGEGGIAYASTDLAGPFLAYLREDYAQRLRDTARWVTANFGPHSPRQLQRFVAQNVNRWGGEFAWERLPEDVGGE